MSQGICEHCGLPFERYRNRKDQRYCGKPACQKARKAKWQRENLKNNPTYKAEQKQAQKDWCDKTPEYWKRYRKNHPKSEINNRIRQRIRNLKRRSKNQVPKALKEEKTGDTSKVIAKMDALNLNDDRGCSQFWLVPVIAKMDALKVNIHVISGNSCGSIY